MVGSTREDVFRKIPTGPVKDYLAEPYVDLLAMHYHERRQMPDRRVFPLTRTSKSGAVTTVGRVLTSNSYKVLEVLIDDADIASGLVGDLTAGKYNITDSEG